MLRFYYAIFLFLLTSSLSAQSFVARSAVSMRSGPGAYYDLVLRVNKDAELSSEGTEEEGWQKVKIDEFVGWVPKQVLLDKATAEQQKKQKKSNDPFADAFSDMDSEFGRETKKESGSAYASPAQVAAVVKGFAKKYKTDRRKDDTVVDYTGTFDSRINARDYRRFRKSRVSDGDWKRLKERIPLQFDELPESSLDADMIGLGIANSIAQQGLVSNYDVQEYLNYIGLTIAESSHRFEIPVQIHIMDTNELVGFACPNGIIFVSRGTLKTITNEAEFAFFIAHELTHVTMEHGLQELENRKVKISADNAFSELDEQMDYANRQDDEYVKVSQDLSAFADEVFEYLMSEKLEKYEREADSLGFVYMARAGYNPSAGLALLDRFLRSAGDYAEQKQGNLNWQGLSLETRIKEANATVSRLNMMGVSDGMHSDEWRQKIQSLR